ncbi:MAG: hypothetical protein QW035_02735 [Candidatus Anstonellales archaeon]
MKGIQKIGAIVGGTALLAGAAFAGLAFEDMELVNPNGQPTVKVVAGAKAAISDGIVAANIATKIANSAYGKKTYTATVTGLSSVTCTGGGAGGTGTCTVKEGSESVTLDITVPGLTGSAHNFQILIGDYVDRELENRENYNTADWYDTTTSETSINAHPYSDGNGGTVAGAYSDVALYRIDGGKFSAFADKTIVDPRTASSYTESQAVYVAGQGQYDEAEEDLTASMQGLIYQVKFDENTDNGIPVCDPKDSKSAKDYTMCEDHDRVDNHRMKVWFLGSEWVIVEMEPATDTIDGSGVKVVAGGSVTLAKESVYGFVNVGEYLDAGEIKVRLDDITAGDAAENQRAVISVLDANGQPTGVQDTITPGSTKKVLVGGKEYRIRVYQTAPGYTFGAKWAEMALISEEFTITDQEYMDEPNDLWKASVLWKNRDATTDDGNNNNGYEEQPDYLRAILLQRTDFNDVLFKGDVVNIVEDPVAFKFAFNGLDLTSSDYDRLQFKLKKTPFSITLTDNSVVPLTNVVEITTSEKTALEMKNDGCPAGTPTPAGPSDKAYLDLDNSMLYLKESSSSSKYVLACDNTANASDYAYLVYYSAGDYYDPGDLWTSDDSGGIMELFADNDEIWIYVHEDAGGVASDDHVADVWEIDGYYDGSSWSFQNTPWTANDKVYYYSTGDTYYGSDLIATTGEKEEGYVSERGSVFVSETGTAMEFKIAKKLGHLLFSLMPNVEAGSAESTRVVLHEGEQTTIGGVTVKVVSIDEQLNPCTVAGGSASCTVAGTDGVSAVISPENKHSVDVAVPYAVSNLVLLDSEAGSVGAVISVGGPAVNTVTANALTGSDVTLSKPGDKVVKKIGSTIVVAGYTAEDTMEAGRDFLAALKSN